MGNICIISEIYISWAQNPCIPHVGRKTELIRTTPSQCGYRWAILWSSPYVVQLLGTSFIFLSDHSPPFRRSAISLALHTHPTFALIPRICIQYQCIQPTWFINNSSTSFDSADRLCCHVCTDSDVGSPFLKATACRLQILAWKSLSTTCFTWAQSEKCYWQPIESGVSSQQRNRRWTGNMYITEHWNKSHTLTAIHSFNATGSPNSPRTTPRFQRITHRPWPHQWECTASVCAPFNPTP